MKNIHQEKIEKMAIKLLSETNDRWLSIHSMILNRLPISVEFRDEYQQSLDRTITTFQQIQQARDEEIIEKIKKLHKYQTLSGAKDGPGFEVMVDIKELLNAIKSLSNKRKI